MKLEKNDWIAGGLYLVLTLLFFAQFLTGEQLLGFKDLSRYFYPLRYLMVEQVKAGLLPLWNPYIFCGYPLLATLQVGFFYPLSVIHYLLPFNLAFNYYTILHYFLAACFMYLLLKHYQLGRPAAFTGGAVFAFSGYLLSVSNMNTSLSSVIWLPLIVLVFDRLLKEITYWRIGGLALLLATQFLGGEPTIIYVTLWLLAAYAFVFAADRAAALKGVGALLASGLIALGLCAVQLLPFLELASLSDRVVRTSYEAVTARSLPPGETINFLFPYFFGNPAQFGGFTDVLVGRNFQDWLLSPYLGIIPLVLLLFSFAGDKKRPWFFLAAALAGLLLAFGCYTPLYRLIYLIPGVALIRYPVKYLFLVTFALAALAAIGLERLLNLAAEEQARIVGRFIPPLAVLSAVFAGAFFWRNEFFAWLARHYSASLPKLFFKMLAGLVEFNLLSLGGLVLYLLAFTAILWAAGKGKITRELFGGLIVLLVCADLLASGATIAVPVSASVMAAVPPNYQLLAKTPELARFYYTPDLDQANRLVIGENYNDALAEAKDNLTANWHIPYHFYDFFGYESVLPHAFYDYYTKQLKPLDLAALARANIRFVGSTKALQGAGLKLLRHKHKYGLDTYLYENQNVKPRAYLLDGGASRITGYRPGEIVVEAEPRRPGKLFLAESFYPGWQVYVDGKPAKLERARDFYCAVDLPAGRHRVRFVYSPASFKIGAIISLLTILGLAVWLGRKKKCSS